VWVGGWNGDQILFSFPWCGGFSLDRPLVSLSLSLSYIRTVVGYDKYSYFMKYGSNARYHGFMLDEI